MRTIMVMNPKGGCGKTTIATNLAAHFADQRRATALVDLDPQRSSLDWLSLRAAERAPIKGVAAYDGGFNKLDHDVDVMIIDAPARAHGGKMTDLVRRVETVVVPVLPSPVDIYAAKRFGEELASLGGGRDRKARIGLVANRVRENTLVAHDLGVFLERMGLPVVAWLRETQNYVHAFARGLGVVELPAYKAGTDVEQFDDVTRWLNSRRSRPAA